MKRLAILALLAAACAESLEKGQPIVHEQRRVLVVVPDTMAELSRVPRWHCEGMGEAFFECFRERVDGGQDCITAKHRDTYRAYCQVDLYEQRRALLGAPDSLVGRWRWDDPGPHCEGTGEAFSECVRERMDVDQECTTVKRRETYEAYCWVDV